jgi:hypothetical protein
LCVHESFLYVYVVRCKYCVRCSVFIFLFQVNLNYLSNDGFYI